MAIPYQYPEVKIIDAHVLAELLRVLPVGYRVSAQTVAATGNLAILDQHDKNVGYVDIRENRIEWYE